jgi:complete genome
MCADFGNLKKEVTSLEKAGADIFHIDIMDGKYVPTIGMGLQDFKVIRETTDLMLDVHLMVEKPSAYVQMFAELGADIIYIHPNSENLPESTLYKIKSYGKKAGIVLNPGTSISEIQELLPLVDYVLVMTVYVGFSGQKYLDFVDEKIQQLLTLKTDYHFEVVVDGAITQDKIQKWNKVGVKGFVLGTSALFGKDRSYDELISIYKSR